MEQVRPEMENLHFAKLPYCVAEFVLHVADTVSGREESSN